MRDQRDSPERYLIPIMQGAVHVGRRKLQRSSGASKGKIRLAATFHYVDIAVHDLELRAGLAQNLRGSPGVVHVGMAD